MITFPLTIYYDASCRLCDSEIQNIKLHDHSNLLQLIDCSAQNFDDTELQNQGVTREKMMNRLHVQDADGQWLIGVAAFEVIYRAVGMHSIATLWGSSFTRPWAEKLYPWIAKHRYTLSKMGLSHLFGLWSKVAARRADQLSQSCQKGLCDSNR